MHCFQPPTTVDMCSLIILNIKKFTPEKVVNYFGVVALEAPVSVTWVKEWERNHSDLGRLAVEELDSIFTVIFQMLPFVFYSHFSLVIFNQLCSIIKDKQISFGTFINSREMCGGGMIGYLNKMNVLNFCLLSIVTMESSISLNHICFSAAGNPPYIKHSCTSVSTLYMNLK